MVELKKILVEYTEKNSTGEFEPVAVGKYGIRKRSDIYKKELAKDYSKNKIIRKNTLIVGMGSTQIDIGVLATDEVYSVSPAYHTFKINTEITSAKFIDVLFKAKNEEYTKKYMIAGARQGKSVNLKDLLKERVHIPSPEEQDKIVELYDKIKSLIEIEQKNIIDYTQLKKAVFEKMFGNPKQNQFRWEMGVIADYFKIKGGKRIPKGLGYSDDKTSHPYLRATDMKNETILDDDIHYVDEQVFEQIKNYTVKAGDIYLTNVGAKLGMAGVIPKKYEGANLTENAVKLINKTNKEISGLYVAHYINSRTVQEFIDERKMAVGVPKLAIVRIETMPMMIPPIEKQREFEKIVLKINQIIEDNKNRIKILDELLNKELHEKFN